MSSVKLDWASAEVKNSKLTVPLAGDPPKGWKQSFERTETLLGNGEWGEVKLKKGAVHVSDVEPGTEEKLRHHLEAIVDQANATHEERERDKDKNGEDKNGEDKNGKEPEGPDAEMADRFRGFADAADDADDDDETKEGA
jgi:hypothetical protein